MLFAVVDRNDPAAQKLTSDVAQVHRLCDDMFNNTATLAEQSPTAARMHGAIRRSVHTRLDISERLERDGVHRLQTDLDTWLAEET